MTSAAHIKVRRSRAVWDRSVSDSRLLPKSSPNIVSLLNTPSGDGRSIDSTRHALLQGNHCRENAPLTGRVFLAAIDLVGDSIQPAIGGTRAIAPSHDSTVVSIGELRFNHDGLGSMFPFLRVVERHCWTGMPHTEIFSSFLHLLKIVWGRRRVVADVEHPLRRTTGIGPGVAAFLRKSPGPSIASPSLVPSPSLSVIPEKSGCKCAEALIQGLWCGGGSQPLPTYSFASFPVEASLVGAIPAAGPLVLSHNRRGGGSRSMSGGGTPLQIRHVPLPTHQRKETASWSIPSINSSTIEGHCAPILTMERRGV